MPMTPETQLTDDERLEWEAEKYSSRTLSVRVLSSGRVVICTPGLTVVSVWDQHLGADLIDQLAHFCFLPIEAYRPPKERIVEKLHTGLSLSNEALAELIKEIKL